MFIFVIDNATIILSTLVKLASSFYHAQFVACADHAQFVACADHAQFVECVAYRMGVRR